MGVMGSSANQMKIKSEKKLNYQAKNFTHMATAISGLLISQIPAVFPLGS